MMNKNRIKQQQTRKRKITKSPPSRSPIRRTRPTKTSEDFLRMLHKTKDLWGDSGSNESDNENDEYIISSTKKTDLRTPHQNNSVSIEEITEQPSSTQCCLICSVLHALTSINCCPEHLATLTNDHAVPTNSSVTSLRAPVMYMMTPVAGQWPVPTCPCQSHCSKSKRRHRSRSSTSSSSSSSSTSSSSSSNSRRPARKRPNVTPFPKKSRHILVPSATTNSEISRHSEPESSIIQTPMSPSLPPSRTLSSMTKKPSGMLLTNSIISHTPREQRSVQFITPSEEQQQPETDSNITYTPRLLLDRIVHVKDDGEQLFSGEQKPKKILNMSQATKQMINQTYSTHPKIYLKRIIFDNDLSLIDLTE